MNREQKKGVYIALVLIGIAAIICVIFQYNTVSKFNSQYHTSHGRNPANEVFADIHLRGGKTSKWKKNTLDLYGATYDAAIHNKSLSKLENWTLRINIASDCYINKVWNGKVEIHQYVGSEKEAVQTVNLMENNSEELKLDYIIDASDLLIPLKKGDYVIYYPSRIFYETPIESRGDSVVGMIFYYDKDIDLSDYEVGYYLYKDFKSGTGFILILNFIFIWITVFCCYMIYMFSYRRVQRDMELKKSGISCMSELYAVVYIIDLVDDTVTPVGIPPELDKLRPKELGARAQFENFFKLEPEDTYQDLMLEFGDLNTLAERLENRNNIATEYLSRKFGWSRIQFIVMDRKEGQPVRRVLFTVQNINQEKEELKKMMGKIEEAESESRAKSSFLASMSREISTPINTILSLDELIINESSETGIRSYGEDIKNAGRLLLILINSILDFSKLEVGKVSLNEGEYSLRELIESIKKIIEPQIWSRSIELKMDITETIPDRLYGNYERLEQIIINLLISAQKNNKYGRVKLSVFGKTIDEETEHLLISVKYREDENAKDLGEGDSDIDEINGKSEIGISLVKRLLMSMNSELKISKLYGCDSEYYFEIDEKIIDSKPIGKIEWNEESAGDF